MNDGYNRLLRTIGSHVARQTRRADFLELGTIGGDMSLKLDRFSKSFPQGEYLVARTLALEKEIQITTDPAGEGPHQHTLTIKAEDIIKPLSPGDRVLVAWVNDGTDPVVIDVVR